MTLPGINILAVIVAAVVYFILGAVWYSPLLFAKPFIKYRGANPQELQGQPTDYLIALVGSVIAALVLSLVVKSVNATTVVDGILIGLIACAGFAATSTLSFTIFTGPHKMLWVIYSGYQLVAFAIMGAILALWK